jgi:hypothetical protein
MLVMYLITFLHFVIHTTNKFKGPNKSTHKYEEKPTLKELNEVQKF